MMHVVQHVVMVDFIISLYLAQDKVVVLEFHVLCLMVNQLICSRTDKQH